MDAGVVRLFEGKQTEELRLSGPFTGLSILSPMASKRTTLVQALPGAPDMILGLLHIAARMLGSDASDGYPPEMNSEAIGRPSTEDSSLKSDPFDSRVNLEACRAPCWLKPENLE